MFSLHHVTVYIILFFLLYNAIGKNGTISNKAFMRFRRYIDVKTARYILNTKRLKFKEINELYYNTLKYINSLVLTLIILFYFLFKGAKINGYSFVFGVLVIQLLLIGLTSSKKVFSWIKKALNNLVYFFVLASIVILVIYFSGNMNLLKKAFSLELELLNIKDILGYSIWNLIFVFSVVNILAWITLRIVTKFLLWLLVILGNISYWLNNTSPLKPFYLLSQVIVIIVVEFSASH